MSQEEIKPRFKGIENLLKRIAFNLGNTPSQTEVKIISCIPIDVTDLQNKIVELEKELDERAAFEVRQARVAVHTALTEPPSQRAPLAPASQNLLSASTSSPSTSTANNAQNNHMPVKVNGYDHTKEIKNEGLFQKIKRADKKKLGGRTHMVYYAQTSNDSPFTYSKEKQEAGCSRQVGEQDTVAMSREYLADVVQRQYRPMMLGAESSFSSYFSSPVCRDEPSAAPPPACNSDMCSCCRGPFHNLDVMPHDPGFLNVDIDPPPGPVLTPVAAAPERDHNVYYDSSVYDVVPVKERPAKDKNEILYEFRGQKWLPIYPEAIHVRPRNQSNAYGRHYSVAPALIRYNHKTMKRKHSLIQRREQVLRAMQKRKRDYLKEVSSLSCAVECGEVYEKHVDTTPKVPKTWMGTTFSPAPPPPRPLTPRVVLLKNAECLTTSVQDTECQTVTSRSVQLEPPPPPDESKTETTLDQIKTILHAVLTEVKTNAQAKTLTEEKSTKDALVQNGPSQNNMAKCSSFIHSYTYSPYNMSPSNMNSRGQSCSQPIPDTNPPVCMPRTDNAPPPPSFPPHKCLQNYPLFIHTPGRPCACCYGSIPTRVPRAPVVTTTHTVQATNYMKATPTDTSADKQVLQQQRSKQTDKLIKDIYKSLAVGMDYPKETSNSDTPEEKPPPKAPPKMELKIEPKAKRVSAAASEEMRHTVVRGTSPLSVQVSRPTGTEPSSDTASGRYRSELERRSAGTSSAGDEGRLQETIRRLLVPRSEAPAASQRARAAPPATIYSDEDSDTATTESVNSEVTVVAKTEKTGFFSKMKRLFTQKRRRRKSSLSSSVADEPASDSDDYETVYSEKSRRSTRRATYRERTRRGRGPAPPSPPPQRRRPPHSTYTRDTAPRRHRQREIESTRQKQQTPYMDQEYRRYWDEKLMFHEGDTPRYSSERPFSRDLERRPRRPRPPAAPSAAYWREYQTRAALVERSSPQETHTQINQPSPREPPVKVFQATPAHFGPKHIPWYKKLKCAPNWKQIILES